jgi:hypothetical protein
MELERTSQEAVVASFKVLSRHSPGGTEENHKNIKTAGFRVEIWTRGLPVFYHVHPKLVDSFTYQSQLMHKWFIINTKKSAMLFTNNFICLAYGVNSAKTLN